MHLWYDVLFVELKQINYFGVMCTFKKKSVSSEIVYSLWSNNEERQLILQWCVFLCTQFWVQGLLRLLTPRVIFNRKPYVIGVSGD